MRRDAVPRRNLTPRGVREGLRFAEVLVLDAAYLLLGVGVLALTWLYALALQRV